jgi:hypothetical protein
MAKKVKLPEAVEQDLKDKMRQLDREYPVNDPTAGEPSLRDARGLRRLRDGFWLLHAEDYEGST